MILTSVTSQNVDDEMKSILENYNEESQRLCNVQALANWDVQTDVGNKTKEMAQVRIINQY